MAPEFQYVHNAGRRSLISGNRMMLCCFIVFLLWALTASLGGCRDKQEENAPLKLEDAVISVETVQVTVRDIIEGINVTGTLSPKFQTDVKSEYTGIVNQVFVTEWQQVKKGDALAKLDTREGDILLRKASAAVNVIKASQVEAQVEANKAAREFERLSNLSKAGLVTQQNLDDARTAKEAVEARIDAIKAQIEVAEEEVQHARTRLGKAVIYAPINGVVAYRSVNVGDLVGEVGSPKVMFRIVDNRVLDLTCAVPSWELKNVNLGQALDFWTDAIPGKTFNGVVGFINPVVNEADRSVNIIAEVKNDPPLLKGGLFVKGLIKTGIRANAMHIPKSALINWDMDQRRATVFIAAGDMIEILAGLTPADTVIVRGGFQIKDGDRISIISAKKAK
ncbi:MAG: efflux RND transporter periplasmic adaptor subunit [Desulfosalsimonadaceae bacterium]